MGVRKWLSGLMGQGPEIVGTSKGGSRLLKYGGSEFSRPQVGFTEESTEELDRAREQAYESMFGTCDFVYHELLPLVPHVDVYKFNATRERPFHTFVTGGMGDVAMNSPEELGGDYRRVELVFYASEDKQEYQELLRRLAHFPHDNRTWIHWGHTMPNGTPPEPVFGSGPLDCIFFMPSILKPDSGLGERLSWQGEPVNLVWCVPITTAECDLKLEKGAEALYQLFDRVKHPFVYSGSRESYV